MPRDTLQHAVPTPIITGEKPYPAYPFEPERASIQPVEVAEELAAVTPAMTPAPPKQRITPTLTQEVKDRGYKNFTLDLGTARTLEALGLHASGIVADSMSIIKAEDAFDYALNSPANDVTPAEKGMSEDQFEIEEVYISNSASAGKTAIIRVVWNPRLIRPT